MLAGCGPKLSLNLTTVNTVGAMHVGNFQTASYSTSWIDATSSQYGTPIFITCGFMDGSVPYFGGRNTSNAVDIQPSFWKNGDVTQLADSGSVEAIYVLRGDVYSSGYIIRNKAKVPVFWKNTTMVELQSAIQATTKKIYVFGSDVYVAGFDNGEAVYWKNGSKVGLGLPLQITDMAVASGDVHIVGYTLNNLAFHWQGGNVTNLPLSSGATTGKANSIFIDGSDIYIAGEASNGSTSTAIYWKNGATTVLSDGTRAVSITKSDADIYVLGYAINQSSPFAVPVYWKNNEQKAMQIDDSHQFEVFHFTAVNLKNQL